MGVCTVILILIVFKGAKDSEVAQAKKALKGNLLFSLDGTKEDIFTHPHHHQQQ